MKFKVVLSLLVIAIIALSALSYVSAADISASFTAEQGGVEVNVAEQGSTIQLVSSFTITPSALGTGTVFYIFAADGVNYGPATTITTYSNWDGTERTADFTLTDVGSYIFFLKVDSGYNSATTTYPSTGSFTSNPEPPQPVPEAPSSVIAMVVAFAAVGVFVAVKKRRKQ